MTGVATIEHCPCCFSRAMEHNRVLWPDLIEEWGLAPDEAEYIDRQQGLRCARCKVSLRGMALAEAVMQASRSRIRPFAVWTLAARGRVLEMNAADGLHRYLRFRPGITFAEFPEVDLQKLPYQDGAFDLVIHSDTLEHVPDPVQALRECRRVLRPRGALTYTIPIVLGRTSRRRDDLPSSYHGGEATRDYEVVTEYGADFWAQPLAAGFRSVEIVCVDYPGGLAVICRR